MKISKLINELQKIQKERGDLSIQILSREYQNDDRIGVYGGGGGGWSNIWHGSIRKIQISEKYPNQIEIWANK